MLTELTVRNFKSFGDDPQTLPLARVTLLIGANGSGKSNVLDALQFLKFLALSRPIPEILEGGAEGGEQFQSGIRGGTTGVCRLGMDEFQLGARVKTLDQPRFHLGVDILTGESVQMTEPATGGSGFFDLRYQLSVKVRPSPQIVSEELDRVNESSEVERIVSTKLCSSAERGVISFGRDLEVSSDMFQTSLLRPVQGLAGFQNPHIVIAYRLIVGGVYFLNVRPSLMGGYRPKGFRAIGGSGENISPVLYDLCDDPPLKEQLVEWVSAFCAPEVVDIDFNEAPGDKVQVVLIEGAAARNRISADNLSDGTLRFLAMVAALFAAPSGQVFVFEEIENGLHPMRMHLLVELLEEIAIDRDLQIIATTHSGEVLQRLSQKALADALLFTRDETTEGTVVNRVGDIDHFDEVSQRAGVDELFSAGWLEFAR